MRVGTVLLRWLRVAGALTLVVALTPLGFGTSAASQQGEDHKVTLCHRTNSENNPYVEITIDKAAVFKRGHDTHDEGGVYQPGDKARGVRWGDIIPAFDYYASPQDKRNGVVSHYDGLNTTAEGLEILANGCEVPDEVPEPAGTLSGECVEDGSFVVSGTLEADGADADFRLSLSTGETIALSGTSFEETIDAPPGTTVQLQVKVDDGDWTDLDDPLTVEECEQPEELGKIKVEKVYEGDPIGTTTDFTARVDCPGTEYDEDLPLNAGNGWANQTGWIPSGTECQVHEVDVPRGWDPEPDEPVTVTVGTGEPETVSVTLRNVRRVGRVEIVKLFEGAPADEDTQFTVRLDCEGTDYDKTAVLDADNDWTVLYAGIPSGITCTVTETDVPDGWELKSISPAEFEIDSYATITVEVTNEREEVPVRTGSVEVQKAFVGEPAASGTTFTALLDCDVDAYDASLPLTAANSWTARVDGIPAGTQCEVKEPSVPAGWERVSVSPQGEFTIEASTVVAVTVTNKREAVVPPTGVISVTKVLDGSASGASTSFTFDVDCPGTAHDQSVTVNVASGTSATGTTTQIPTGLTCTVTERSTPGWSQTGVVPANGAVAVGSTVTFTNRREQVTPPQGGLTITKAVSPVSGQGVVVQFGDTLTYTLTVNATGTLTQPNVIVTDYVPGLDPARQQSGKTTYVTGSATCLGTGACTVTEPGADGLITWRLGDMAGGTSRQVTFQVVINDVAVAAGQTVSADILNAGAVKSDVTPTVPSNEVITSVTETLPVKQGQPPAAQPPAGQPPAAQPPAEQPPAAQPEALPVTGGTVPWSVTAALGGLLLLMGLALVVVARPKRGQI